MSFGIPRAQACNFGWMYEDDIPIDYNLADLYPYSRVIFGVRMYPFYCSEPCKYVILGGPGDHNNVVGLKRPIPPRADHSCGGPEEACMEPGCEECGS